MDNGKFIWEELFKAQLASLLYNSSLATTKYLATFAWGVHSPRKPTLDFQPFCEPAFLAPHYRTHKTAEN